MDVAPHDAAEQLSAKGSASKAGDEFVSAP